MKKILFFLFLGISILLTACGGGGKPSTTIDVTMTDFRFMPDQFTIPAGKDITINATNNGAVVHNFVLMKLGTNAGDTWGDEDIPNIFWEMELQPGTTESQTFTAPSDPGEYQVVCRTPGHIAAGMVAKLTVVAGE